MDIDAFTRPLRADGYLDVEERSIEANRSNGAHGCTALPGRRHPA